MKIFSKFIMRHIRFFFSFLLAFAAYPFTMALAQSGTPPPPPPPPGGIAATPMPSAGGLPYNLGSWGGGFKPVGPTEVGLALPSTSVSTIQDFYQATCAVTQWLMVFGLIIGVAFVIYGGVRYITSGGDEGKAGDAKKTILTALIGVVFLVLAVALVRIVASFFGATGFNLNLTTASCASYY